MLDTAAAFVDVIVGRREYDTQVICTAMIEEKVPQWMKFQNVPGGWLSAEYAMLPGSTLERKARDSSKGKVDGRRQTARRCSM